MTPVAGTAGLFTDTYDESFDFVESSGEIGRWFEADAGQGPQLPQITAGRPTQPRSELDVTADAGDGTLLPAHGAVVTVLDTDRVVDRLRRRLQPADARQRRRARGGQLGRRLPDPARRRDHRQQRRRVDRARTGSCSVNSSCSSLASSWRPVDSATGTGAQVLFDRMAGQLYYSTSSDWTPPQVVDVGVARSAGATSADLSVVAADLSGVTRVVALYQSGGDWSSVDLDDTGGIFTASVAVPASSHQRADPGRRAGRRRRRQRGVGSEQGSRVQSRRRPRPPARR